MYDRTPLAHQHHANYKQLLFTCADKHRNSRMKVQVNSQSLVKVRFIIDEHKLFRCYFAPAWLCA